MTILLKKPVAVPAPLLFPLMNFTAFAGGSRDCVTCWIRLKGGYTSFVFVSCYSNRRRSAAFSPASGSRATSSAVSRAAC